MRRLNGFRFAARFPAACLDVAVPAVGELGGFGVGHFADVSVRRVFEAAVVREGVALDLVGIRFVDALVFAFDCCSDAAFAVVFGRDRIAGVFFDARVGDKQNAPGAVAGGRVADGGGVV